MFLVHTLLQYDLCALFKRITSRYIGIHHGSKYRPIETGLSYSSRNNGVSETMQVLDSITIPQFISHSRLQEAHRRGGGLKLPAVALDL